MNEYISFISSIFIVLRTQDFLSDWTFRDYFNHCEHNKKINEPHRGTVQKENCTKKCALTQSCCCIKVWRSRRVFVTSHLSHKCQ